MAGRGAVIDGVLGVTLTALVSFLLLEPSCMNFSVYLLENPRPRRTKALSQNRVCPFCFYHGVMKLLCHIRI